MTKLVCLDCGQINRVPDAQLGAGPKCGTCGAILLSGKAQEIDAGTLKKAIRVDDFPLVVDFWAPWCGPCRMMGPEFSKAAGMLKGQVRLVKLNTEAHQSAAASYRIRGIPTMISFRRGKEAGRQSGALRAQGIADFATGRG
ncbi:thioredoxin TrxC [Citreicella sp. C3M06]|uniref:thioredoxin TrxC n=1 Tax=Citreicella sp. C3M06 TaxID=2841564 RepID=UPI001C07FCFB|nr:thioredoxin TrxC [Citreicella sp. C3M06]MBU2959701.1 thioredoxin TrxC [Citreicella sp. C3M06]